MTFSVRTEVFDGPLDLLLYLVKRDGVDLLDIRVSRIADAYLEYLDRMREVQLGVAAEYLVLASTLCHLKSLEILPRPPTSTSVDEEPVDPRQELIRRLVEYERYRRAAEDLDEGPVLGREVFAREPTDLGHVPRPFARTDPFLLLDTYHDLLRRQDEADPVLTIHRHGLDLGGCCRFVLAALGGPGGREELGALLVRLPTRVERVVVFLAVLEMARLGWLWLEQTEHLGPVALTCKVATDVDLSPVVGRIAVETVAASA